MENITLQPLKTPWSFLWNIIKPYKWWYALILQAPILTSIYFLTHNYALKLLIDAFSVNEDITYGRLAYPIGLFISAQIGLNLLYRVSDFAQYKIEPLIRKKLWISVYDYVQHHSHQFFKNTASGLILSKIRGIIEGYDLLIATTIRVMGRQCLVVILSILSLGLINIKVCLFVLAWCSLFIGLTLPMSLKMKHYASNFAQAKHQFMGQVADNITNVFSLFYFGKRQFELQRLQKALNATYFPTQKAVYYYDLKFNILCSILYGLMLVSIFLLMIYFKQIQLISNGDFIFVMTTTLAITYDLLGLLTNLSAYIKQISDFKSAFELLKTPHDKVDANHAKAYQIKHGKIEFKDVGFSYIPQKTIFTHLNFTLNAGEKIGIVGSSGAGKSTLIALLLKSISPSKGEIYIDNIALKEMTQEALCDQIAYIPQDLMLFNRSLGENIGYANEKASLEEIKTAAKLAHIHDFIMSLPEQYETLVGERGLKLSGGQRQRIGLARAFLKKTPLLILDEATASLDAQSEFLIQKALEAEILNRQVTVIVIAHRLTTLKNMDRILVIQQGRIVEEGHFETLVTRAHGVFKNLWQHQIEKEVLIKTS